MGQNLSKSYSLYDERRDLGMRPAKKENGIGITEIILYY